MKKVEKKENDVLSQVKRIEKFKRMQLLAEVIEELKSKAKEILLLKEETTQLLAEVGVSEEDSKKVIDYINSIAKLTKHDREKLKEGVRELKEEKEEKISKKMEDKTYPEFFAASTNSTSTNSNSGLSISSTTYGGTGATGFYAVKLGDSGQYINV